MTEYLQMSPTEADFGTHGLLPVTGPAFLFWPYNIAQNLQFMYNEPKILHGLNVHQGMSSPYYIVQYIEAGTYSINWSIHTDPSTEGTIICTYNGGTLMRIRQLRDDEDGYTDESVVYSACYPVWVAGTTGWYTFEYNVYTWGSWCVEAWYSGGQASRFNNNQIPGAVGLGE